MNDNETNLTRNQGRCYKKKEKILSSKSLLRNSMFSIKEGRSYISQCQLAYYFLSLGWSHKTHLKANKPTKFSKAPARSSPSPSFIYFQDSSSRFRIHLRLNQQTHNQSKPFFDKKISKYLKRLEDVFFAHPLGLQSNTIYFLRLARKDIISATESIPLNRTIFVIWYNFCSSGRATQTHTYIGFKEISQKITKKKTEPHLEWRLVTHCTLFDLGYQLRLITWACTRQFQVPTPPTLIVRTRACAIMVAVKKVLTCMPFLRWWPSPHR